MKMKDVMKATGLQENTIRFYESKNLLSPTKERRNGRTYHEYSLEDVKTLKNILVGIVVFLTVKLVRTVPAPSGTTEGWIYYNADGG